MNRTVWHHQQNRRLVRRAAKELDRARQGQHTSFKKLGQRMGLHHDTARRPLRGERNPTLATLARLARLVDRRVELVISEGTGQRIVLQVSPTRRISLKHLLEVVRPLGLTIDLRVTAVKKKGN